MKKLFVLIAVIAFSMSTFARIGVSMGYQQKTTQRYATTTSIRGNAEDRTMNGLTVGLFYDMELSERLSFRPGINYEYSTYVSQESLFTTKLFDNVISIPVRLKFELFSFKKFSLSLVAGPTLDLGLSLAGMTETKVLGSVITTDIPNEYDKPENGPYTKSFNLLLGGGLTVEYREFELGIMTDWGLLNLHGGANVSGVQNYRYVNKPISIRLAYLF